MLVEEIQKICKKFPHVTEEIKWETHLCYCIGGKMFMVVNPDSNPVTASFKANDEDFAELPEREGFIPAPYMARHKWIYVDTINRFSKKQWEEYLKKAYTLVAAKLPAKLKKEFGIKVI